MDLNQPQLGSNTLSNKLSIIENSTINSTKSERFLTTKRNFGLTRFEGDLTNPTRNNLDCINWMVLPILVVEFLSNI